MRIPEDVLGLIRAEQKAQGGLFMPDNEAYLDRLSRNSEWLIERDGSEVLGYAFFYCNSEDKKSSYITLIGTSEQARGTGVGYQLLQQVLRISKQRGFSCCQLEVRKSNARALGFYQRVGFAVVEDRGEKYLMSISTR